MAKHLNGSIGEFAAQINPQQQDDGLPLKAQINQGPVRLAGILPPPFRLGQDMALDRIP